MPGVSNRGPTAGAMGVGKVHFKFKPKKPKRSTPVKIIGTLIYVLFFTFAFFSYSWKYVGFRNRFQVPLVRFIVSSYDNAKLFIYRKYYSIPDTVQRDHNGTPLIRANSTLEAIQQQGYVHGLDRWLQMDMYRRIAFGEVSALMGVEKLTVDRLSRSLQMGKRALEDFKFLDVDEVAVLTAYTAGVNKYLEEEGLLNYRAFDYNVMFGSFYDYTERIRPWRPEDSLAILRLQAYEWSHGWEQDLFSLMFAGSYPSNEFGVKYFSKRQSSSLNENLSKDDDSTGATTTLVDNSCSSTATSSTTDSIAKSKSKHSLHFFPSFSGTAIAVSGSKSASGGALLAADFYAQTKSSEGLWHVISINSPEYAAVGASLPGIPYVMMGRNRNIGWAVSLPANIDGTGFSNEHIHILAPEEEASIITHLETIAITTDAYYSEYNYDSFLAEESEAYGVILSDQVFEAPYNATLLRTARNNNLLPKVALRSPAVDQRASLRFLRGLNTAQSLSEAVLSVDELKNMQLNVLLADTRGSITKVSTGSWSSPAAAAAAVEEENQGQEKDEKPSATDSVGVDMIILAERTYGYSAGATTTAASSNHRDSGTDQTCSSFPPSSSSSEEEPGAYGRTEDILNKIKNGVSVDHLKDILLDVFSPSSMKLAKLMQRVSREKNKEYASAAFWDEVKKESVDGSASGGFLNSVSAVLLPSPVTVMGRVVPTLTLEQEQHYFNSTYWMVQDFNGYYDPPLAEAKSDSLTQRPALVLVEAFRFNLLDLLIYDITRSPGCETLQQQAHVILGGSVSSLPRKSIDMRRDPLLLFDTLVTCATSHSSFDNTRQPSNEDRLLKIAQKAVVKAYAFCQKEFGSDPLKWSWAEVHMVKYDHLSGSMAKKQKMSQSVTANGPYSIGGTIDTNMRSEYSRGKGGELVDSSSPEAFISTEETFSSSMR